MQYCENCKILCADDRCDHCGSTLLREPDSRDYCFLCEEDERLAKMLEGALQDQNIPTVLLPWGDGRRSAFGLTLGRFRIYVPYLHYEQATALFLFFDETPTEEVRQELLEHRALWHFDPKLEKKVRKKLKGKEDQQVFDRVEQLVCAAERLEQGGRIYTCPQGGYYILVKADGVRFWFNSATYEVLI